ncbi:Response regulator receiver domain-containing protein [Prosthecobacter debontii]|uniref:Response regulator receiver domain-containing protein n=1 Tax=Prosthecobacter debontii TaxID=48467 RepID=A0A1T4YKA4_9BACT|nr:response regulator transcription factor [Prosthecobacter debontii]SKB02229.1 Response regulator receiver domain-containing protein [Prosthecobacter debontii]
MFADVDQRVGLAGEPGRGVPAEGLTQVLVIDDDKKLCALIRDYLTPLGYAVEMAHTGPEGVVRALERPWHAVILDLMLPGCDGYEVLKQVRAKSLVPILMLTARGDEADRIVGLEMGADDYLPKTFSSRELLARLRAVTRRVALAQAGAPVEKPVRELVGGPVRLNLDARVASLEDQPLVLTPVEFDILAALMKSKGRIRSREALIESLRDREYEVFDRSVDVHIAALRRKLGDDAHEPRFIRTVRSAGYMFIASV